MVLVPRMDPGVASVRRRALAGVVDVLILIAGVGGLLVSRRRLKARRHKPHGARSASPGPATDSRRRGQAARFVQSTRGQLVLRLGSLVLVGVPLRNWRSPGARIAGIQLVDARTGGLVTVRSVVVRDLAGAAFGFLVRRLTAPLQARSQAAQNRLRALGPQMAALERWHADDRAAQQQAFNEFYKANGVNPLGSTVWLIPDVLAMPLTALLSRHRQTIAQRLSGTLVIRSR